MPIMNSALGHVLQHFAMLYWPTVILFWEGCSFEYSLVYMKNMYYQAMNAAKGKKVIITETGWPSKGKRVREAHSSMKNARNYFINTQLWSKADDIDIF